MVGEIETLKLSEKTTVTVGVLDGNESDFADMRLAERIPPMKKGDPAPTILLALLQNKVYSICSIRSLNGSAVEPLVSGNVYVSIAQKLSPAEVKVLNEWGAQHYSPSEEDVKNEPGAEP